MSSYKTFGLVFVVMFCFAGDALANQRTRYLTFQIFTGGFDSVTLRQAFPPSSTNLRQTVVDLRDRIGVLGKSDQQLGFILGPLAFDNSDHDVRRLISTGFDIALGTGVAVGFHIDDSMFWGRLTKLNAPDSIEWTDWRKTLNTGRRLDWSSKPMKIMPQLCFNSSAVKEVVSQRAKLIGNEIAKGLQKLHAAHRDDLFAGVIAGWETQIGKDFNTEKYLGYCALTNAGFGMNNPPANLDIARSKIIMEFASFWAQSLILAGVPQDKVYSHMAYMSSAMYNISKMANPDAVYAPYLKAVNFTPPAAAFCDHCIPGVSTYPQPGHLEQWQEELKKHGNPPWVSSEGTAIDPSDAECSGNAMSMEGYLGNLFNHGAILVNIFGWGVGDESNPFRRIAENEVALAAYRKFIAGETLHETPIPTPVIPPIDLIDKVHKIQAKLPDWIQENGASAVKDNIEHLEKSLDEKRYDIATQAAEAILITIEK